MWPRIESTPVTSQQRDCCAEWMDELLNEFGRTYGNNKPR